MTCWTNCADCIACAIRNSYFLANTNYNQRTISTHKLYDDATAGALKTMSAMRERVYKMKLGEQGWRKNKPLPLPVAKYMVQKYRERDELPMDFTLFE